MIEVEASAELILSEQLNTFSVIEEFCTSCGAMTPHHIDESMNKDGFDDDDEVTTVKPMSTLECVYCREEEESRLSI